MWVPNADTNLTRNTRWGRQPAPERLSIQRMLIVRAVRDRTLHEAMQKVPTSGCGVATDQTHLDGLNPRSWAANGRRGWGS